MFEPPAGGGPTAVEAASAAAAAAPAPSPRYHSLDALRGSMMLLGIWLHAVVAYSRHGGWPWKDGSRTTLFDWTLGLIHLFRMPTFYVMAGFFSALLVARRGDAGFARNRAIRILVPFVAGWSVLFPTVAALIALGMSRVDPRGVPPDFIPQVLARVHPMHLWFLEYLLIFYAIALAARWAAARWPALATGPDRLFRLAFRSPFGPLCFAAITFPCLCLMENGWLDDPRGFLPEPKIVLAYLGFFGGGWFLYRSADLLPRLSRLPWAPLFLLAGLAAWAFAFDCHGRRLYLERVFTVDLGSRVILAFLGCAALHAAGMWLFIFGFTGVFLRFLERPIGWLRYLSDSSYWLYLAHMPVLMIFQIAVARSGWPAAAKMAFVLGASIPVLLASYHYLVRPTWIGAVLNGRRYPIGRAAARREQGGART